MNNDQLSPEKFQQDSFAALNDPQLRRNFKRAMGGLMAKRLAVFPAADEWQELRELGHSIRANALRKLPELLAQLEENCSKNGIQVHWAESVDEANALVLEIAQQHGVKSVVKGKSMVSEEMELNHYLEQHGIEALEADLGEYIIQVDHELPSHIIMPAIHKNKDQIAQMFKEKVDPEAHAESAEEMTAIARKVLRQKFYAADMGVSGVNFAVAETGTLCLVENEGNGRFCTTLPPVHVAVMGLEKVVERLEDVAPLLSLLTRSATGQVITTYFNMITSPRRAPEKDGPQEVHLILLDNGRSRMHADDLLRDTLLCIRCGACMNHCPVYTRIGGHAYNTTYPGPIGKILTPQIKGLHEAGHLADASSLCGACVEVCPVKIPITDILLRLRVDKAENKRKISITKSGSLQAKIESLIWKGWGVVFASPLLYKMKSYKISKIGNYLPGWLPILRNWTAVRSKPVFAKKSLHQLAQQEGLSDE
ncbi:MAG: iron-sulfur cluster-binding protein [SAR324 cluster bacterium]|nr:iron-sulfur cluster-binding protein [SAR324 cluster bacterium]MBL7035525.1 iron-sulfur cluster-binding protein [SAR324 cluster bacterium]